MSEPTQRKPLHGGYIVFQQVADNTWRLLGEVDRRPGLPAKRSRAQAVKDALGREPDADGIYAAVPRSEWRVSLDW